MGACLPPRESLIHYFSEHRGGPACVARGSVVTGELLMGGPEDLGSPQSRSLPILPLKVCPSQCPSSVCSHLGRGLKPRHPMRLVPQGPEGSVTERRARPVARDLCPDFTPKRRLCPETWFSPRVAAESWTPQPSSPKAPRPHNPNPKKN